MEIPLARPDLSQAETDAVVAVMNTPHLSLGPKVPEFEQLFAAYVGTKHAVAVNSGTSALHLCIRAIGVGPGDEVITTPFSFIASSNCILFEGARPVFVDIDADTWNIDPSRIEAAITPRTRAIIPVDVFGQVADMEPILEIARRRGLRVIEDSCEALGGTYGGKRAGGFGDAGVFGFYPNKQITTGEGGMITTNDDAIDRLARSMRNQGRDPEAGWLAHARLGYNFRLPDVNCAIGIAQMHRVEEILAARRRAAGWYAERLADDPRVRMQRCHPKARMSCFVMVVRLSDDDTQADRDRILSQLRDRGIGCNNYFTPIHLQPFYAEQYGHRPGDFPITEGLSSRTIALPFFGPMTEPQVDHACKEFRRLL
jgi:perosamine synthetase